MRDGWPKDPANVAEVTAAGHDIHKFRAESRGHLEAQMTVAGSGVLRLRQAHFFPLGLTVSVRVFVTFVL